MAELPLLSEAGVAANMRVVFRAHSALSDWLALDGVDRPHSATFPILAQFCRLVPATAQPAFVGTIVMCGRLVTIAEIGTTLGMGEDKLRALYHRCGFPPFADVNSGLLAAHAVTSAEGGAGHEAVASRAGFESLDAMNKYLRRHFRQTLKQLAGSGGSAATLDRIGQWFARATDGSNVPISP